MNFKNKIPLIFTIALIISIPLIFACSNIKPGKRYVIGVIIPAPVYHKIIDGLKAEIEAGELKGRVNFIIDDAGITAKDYAASAGKFEDMEVDIIYTITTPVTKSAMSVVNHTPIVFNAVGDPIGAGIVKSLIKSGSNITGTTHLSRELTAKRLELFNTAIPRIKNFVTFYDSSNKFSQLYIIDLREAAAKLRLRVTEIIAGSSEELREKIKKINETDAEGIFIIPDPIVLKLIPEIIKYSHDNKAPIIAHEVDFVEKGAAISYGANFFELGRLSYFHVKALFEGEKADNLPILMPDSFELAVNLTIIRQMDYQISEEMLFFADWIY